MKNLKQNSCTMREKRETRMGGTMDQKKELFFTRLRQEIKSVKNEEKKLKELYISLHSALKKACNTDFKRRDSSSRVNTVEKTLETSMNMTTTKDTSPIPSNTSMNWNCASSSRKLFYPNKDMNEKFERSRSALSIRAKLSNALGVSKLRSLSEKSMRNTRKTEKCVLIDKLSKDEKQRIIQFLLKEYFENLKKRRNFLKELLKDTMEMKSEKNPPSKPKATQDNKYYQINENKENEHPNTLRGAPAQYNVCSSDLILSKFKENLRLISDEISINKRRLELSRERVAKKMINPLKADAEAVKEIDTDELKYQRENEKEPTRKLLTERQKSPSSHTKSLRHSRGEKKNSLDERNSIKNHKQKSNQGGGGKVKSPPTGVMKNFKVNRNYLYIVGD